MVRRKTLPRRAAHPRVPVVLAADRTEAAAAPGMAAHRRVPSVLATEHTEAAAIRGMAARPRVGMVLAAAAARVSMGLLRSAPLAVALDICQAPPQ